MGVIACEVYIRYFVHFGEIHDMKDIVTCLRINVDKTTALISGEGERSVVDSREWHFVIVREVMAVIL